MPLASCRSGPILVAAVCSAIEYTTASAACAAATAPASDVSDELSPPSDRTTSTRRPPGAVERSSLAWRTASYSAVPCWADTATEPSEASSFAVSAVSGWATPASLPNVYSATRSTDRFEATKVLAAFRASRSGAPFIESEASMASAIAAVRFGSSAVIADLGTAVPFSATEKTGAPELDEQPWTATETSGKRDWSTAVMDRPAAWAGLRGERRRDQGGHGRAGCKRPAQERHGRLPNAPV